MRPTRAPNAPHGADKADPPADKTTANKTIEGDYRVDNHGEGD
jgi:hypothetical protein